MPLNTFVENAWYAAGRSQEFPVNQPKGLKICSRPVLVWRTAGGKLASFDDRCVHKRMPLSEGEVLSDGVLECPYHGFCYDATGNCVRIPSQLDLPIPSRAKLRPFPIVEQDGLAWVWVGDRWHTHHMMGPGLTRVELRCAPPGKLGVAAEERGYVIHHSHTPIDGTNHTWRLWVSTRSKNLTSRIAETFPTVMDEDRWALERQQRNFEYPEDGYHEVYLRSDKPLLRCRKILEEMERTNRANVAPVAVHKAA